ncbi:hypothetical protein NQ176_g2878 [Zarea fungicola]|uniref:Uncharacterized protein n=1 Tax=Zarea fungicola TaxID=93591 RepID=A0ACC1NLV3_9HYPO|nr:hypothetical protein NQ176_g2878 [Lecanicillium fungicola]
MNRLKERGMLDLVISSPRLRTAFVSAALQLPAQIPDLCVCAEVLLQQHHYRWPDLYTNIIFSLLEKHAFKEAINAHFLLKSKFIPEQRVLGRLFAQFVTKPDPKMQRTLKTIYSSLAQHKLYDVIIPYLFKSGQSNLARNWRKTLLLHGDSPCSESSEPFLRFLTRYYTTLQLTPEESTVVNANVKVDLLASNGTPERTWSIHSETLAESLSFKKDRARKANQPHQENKALTEGIVTRLFASSWTPIALAIGLASNAGVNSIGPRALQALALRGNSPSAVNEIIKELHELNISIPTNAYCTAIAVFAKQGEHTLLHDLLHSDIHPEEFDDPVTRDMILQDSIMRQDSTQERLAFATFPINGGGIHWKSNECDGILDEIIGVIRSVATQDVAIPVEYWKVLLLGLSHQGKFDMLEQFSLEIVQMYERSFEGLYPIHYTDLPENSGGISCSQRELKNEIFLDRAVAYIPADLPFRHPDHPVRKIFDRTFQRAAVRLGFQWALDMLPVLTSGIQVPNSTAGKLNVACGVRLLANLRDRGVYIDRDSVKSGVRNGIRFSRRLRESEEETGSNNSLSAAQTKTLVDLAWGSELLPVEDENRTRAKNITRSLPMGEDDYWF